MISPNCTRPCRQCPASTAAPEPSPSRRSGDGLLKNVRARAPVDTGAYKMSWHLKMADDRRCVVETPNRKLFTILEYQGSKPHIIRPKNKKVLRWPVRKSKRQTVRTAGPSPALPQGGAQVYAFALEVHHPGFRAIRHARPAHRSVMRQAMPVMWKHFRAFGSWTRPRSAGTPAPRSPCPAPLGRPCPPARATGP